MSSHLLGKNGKPNSRSLGHYSVDSRLDRTLVAADGGDYLSGQSNGRNTNLLAQTLLTGKRPWAVPAPPPQFQSSGGCFGSESAWIGEVCDA